MLRTCLNVILTVGLLTEVLSLRLSVSHAHAQPAGSEFSMDAPARATSPATEGPPPTATDQPTTRVWKPKRFPRLYVLPQQARDDERAPIHESERSSSRARSGLLLGGLTTFAASYIVTAAFSLLVLQQIHADDCAAGNLSPDACSAGARLRIPVVGPFLPSISRKLGELGTAWLGGTQLFGLVLTVLGIVRLATADEVPSRSTASIELQPVPLPGGGMLRTRVTF